MVRVGANSEQSCMREMRSGLDLVNVQCWTLISAAGRQVHEGGVKGNPININGRCRPRKAVMNCQSGPKLLYLKRNYVPFILPLARMRRGIFSSLLLIISAGAPISVTAQFSEIKMGEYLHYATAAANGGVYAGIDGIGYTTVFGSPSLYRTNTGWLDLPCAQGFNASLQIYGTTTGISHDGSVVAGSATGTTTNGTSKQVATYWVNGFESVVPPPPDDPAATLMSATAVSGDGTTLLVQDGNTYGGKVETYIYNIASGTFTSLGFLGGTNQQTFATAINSNGTVVAGYSSLDNGNNNGFIWTAFNGVSVLTTPTNHPNAFYLEPTCISDDGATVYGRLTEGGGWVGFRYNTANGYHDLGDLSPSACTADGTEAVGIENIYFPAIWSLSNGSGYLDHLVSANIATQSLGTLVAPVTISPDGSAITASGPDAYPVDQIWYGVWQILVPSPLKAAPIPAGTESFTTDYETPFSEPPGTLTEYAEFNTGASAVLVRGPHYASAFALNADGSFSYTPQPGYISAGIDPEEGTPVDTFIYHLVSVNGTSSNAQVQITVLAPMPPTVADPTDAGETATSATLGGTVTDGGGATVTAVGVVYAPLVLDSNPEIGDPSANLATGTGTTGVFTVNVSGLTPGTDYAYTAFATNSAGIGYSPVGVFTTLSTAQSWQQMWFGSPTSVAAALNADPYHTGIQNFAVFAYIGPSQDPSTASLSQLPQVQLSGGNLFHDFFEPTGVSGVTYGAQVSTDLEAGNWQPVSDSGSGTEHIFSVPVAANAELFMRLTVAFQ
jgi:probable HAF family extracellular repeat protein